MVTVTTIATVPAVIALSTIAKDLGLQSKFIPLFAVACGVALQLLQVAAVSGANFDLPEVLVQGVLLGLGASGVYDGAKAVGDRAYQPKHTKDVSI